MLRQCGGEREEGHKWAEDWMEVGEWHAVVLILLLLLLLLLLLIYYQLNALSFFFMHFLLWHRLNPPCESIEDAKHTLIWVMVWPSSLCIGLCPQKQGIYCRIGYADKQHCFIRFSFSAWLCCEFFHRQIINAIYKILNLESFLINALSTFLFFNSYGRKQIPCCKSCLSTKTTNTFYCLKHPPNLYM